MIGYFPIVIEFYPVWKGFYPFVFNFGYSIFVTDQYSDTKNYILMMSISITIIFDKN